MHQIKIFKGLENDLTQLEGEVNRWLAQSKVDVVQMFGNLAPQSNSAAAVQGGLSSGGMAPSDVLLVVLYDKRV
jgi:hypothetical protein